MFDNSRGDIMTEEEKYRKELLKRIIEKMDRLCKIRRSKGKSTDINDLLSIKENR